MPTFAQIPSNLRVPGQYTEVDSSQAQQGPALLAYRALIIGQKITAGTATANSLHKVTSVSDVITLAGRGSMLHRQAIAWFANNKFTETWIGVLDDNGAGVAASGTLTVTGPATAAGTLVIEAGGERITVAVASGAVQNDIATALEAAIDAIVDLPATAGVSTNVVTVTHRHKGTVGNDFDLRVNPEFGDAYPAGVSVAVVAMASGATNPVLTSLIAAMGDSWFQVVVHPYTDATSLTAIENELVRRFGPMVAVPGVAITSALGSASTLGTLGDTRNSPHSLIVSQPGTSPRTPPVEFAAEVAALVAFHGAQDPARPFQTLQLARAKQPAESAWFDNTERNLLLFDGIATSKAVAGGKVAIERLVTTYQRNAAGSADIAYLDVNTPLTLIYLRYSWEVRIATKYPRHKLASDGTRFGPGQPVITPKIGKAEALGWFGQMAELGLVEGLDQFKRDVVCVRSQLDPNRLEWTLPPDLVNQAMVFASQLAFRL
jgi:phage tail sheath gpL-like